MTIKRKLGRTVSIVLGTSLLVPGTLGMLFGFLAAGYDDLECGVQIPHFEQIGHEMTGMLLFVVGFAVFVCGLVVLWLAPKRENFRNGG